MSITKSPFGLTPAGEEVTAYTLTNAAGAWVRLIDFGAIVTAIQVPDQNGVLDDVVLGFDSMEGYSRPHGSMGETIGRYGNRIGGASFEIDGTVWPVAANNGRNHLHGGRVGFGARMWQAETREEAHQDSVIFIRLSPDGEEGYPGNLKVSVTYTWNEQNDLVIRYQAETDKPTLLNMTNHTYFNLAGCRAPHVKDQVLYIDADAITPVNAELIPTGAYMAVAGTPFDFREERLIGEGLREVAQNEQLSFGGGYDHNFVLRKGAAFGMAAAAHDEGTGRTLEVLTDQPGVQLYTANTLDIPGGKGAKRFGNHAGFCLETQHYPDSPHNPQFPDTVLRPGQKYDSTTIFAFRVDP